MGFLGSFKGTHVVTSSGPYLNYSWTTATKIDMKLRVNYRCNCGNHPRFLPQSPEASDFCSPYPISSPVYRAIMALSTWAVRRIEGGNICKVLRMAPGTW